jgi:Protein of unknown function (DUF2934)
LLVTFTSAELTFLRREARQLHHDVSADAHFARVHSMAYPTDEQIKLRAHQLWEQAGKPDGRESEFWHLAERDLQEKPEHSESTIVPG